MPLQKMKKSKSTGNIQHAFVANKQIWSKRLTSSNRSMSCNVIMDVSVINDLMNNETAIPSIVLSKTSIKNVMSCIVMSPPIKDHIKQQDDDEVKDLAACLITPSEAVQEQSTPTIECRRLYRQRNRKEAFDSNCNT